MHVRIMAFERDPVMLGIMHVRIVALGADRVLGSMMHVRIMALGRDQVMLGIMHVRIMALGCGSGAWEHGYFRCLTADERDVFYCGRDQGSQSYGLLTGRVANNVYRQTGLQPELLANADCDAMGLDDTGVVCLEGSTLAWIPRAGGAARVLWKSNPPESERLPGELSVALSSQYVYFASTGSNGGLYRVARAGGPREHVANGSVEQIAVDETYVYWVWRSGSVLRRRH